MNVTAALIAQTVPVAGLYLAAERRREQRELFLLGYVTVVGMMLSALAYLDDLWDLTAILGLSIDSLGR